MNSKMKTMEEEGVWDFTEPPTPKVKVHLGVCGFIPSHCFAFVGDSWLHSEPAPFHALAFGCEPKARVMPHYLGFLLYSFVFCVLYSWLSFFTLFLVLSSTSGFFNIFQIMLPTSIFCKTNNQFSLMLLPKQ